MIALLGLAVGLSGCQMVGYALGLGTERVPAEYELEDRPTLVMVEDPAEHLGDPALPGVLARSVEHGLQDNRVLRRNEPIPQSELRAVADELGDDYPQTPIDRLGRLVEAEQVIHVTVREVSMLRQQGLYEPTIELEVKVIDADDSRRLFPELEPFAAGDGPAPGHRFTSQMQITMSDRADQGMQARLGRELAQHAGRDVARLFHSWRRELATAEGQ